jgi:hypothetical protein
MPEIIIHIWSAAYTDFNTQYTLDMTDPTQVLDCWGLEQKWDGDHRLMKE